MSNLKVKVLPLDATVDIKVSGSYTIRIQSILLYLLEVLGQEEYNKGITAIINKKTSEELHAMNPAFIHIETLLMFYTEVEQQAVIQNKAIEKEIPEGEYPNI